MDPQEERRCRTLLEVPSGAGREVLECAYRRLKALYAEEHGICSAPGMDEFSPEARQAVLDDLEAAYTALCRDGAVRLPAPQAAPARSAPPGSLREAREAAGLDLDAIAAETHVRPAFLSALEEERFQDLPLGAVQVRGYLTAYLGTLGLCAATLVPPYLARFQAWLDQGRPGATSGALAGH